AGSGFESLRLHFSTFLSGDHLRSEPLSLLAPWRLRARFSLQKKLTIRRQRADDTHRVRSAAHFLSMTTKQQMCVSQERVVIINTFLGGILDQTVGRGIALLFLAKTETEQHPQPIGLQSQDRILSGE